MLISRCAEKFSNPRDARCRFWRIDASQTRNCGIDTNFPYDAHAAGNRPHSSHDTPGLRSTIVVSGVQNGFIPLPRSDYSAVVLRTPGRVRNHDDCHPCLGPYTNRSLLRQNGSSSSGLPLNVHRSMRGCRKSTAPACSKAAAT